MTALGPGHTREPIAMPHRNPTRRVMLAGAASIGGSLAFPVAARAAGEAPIATRAIPHGAGERLPVVGVGTSKVFEVGSGTAERQVLRGVLDALVAGGGSVVDTASSYGTAEEVIGAISGDMRAKLFLATKLEARRGTEAEAEFARSLKRLRVEKVDLLQAHNIEEGDYGLPFFFELKKRGLTRYVGATTTFSDEYAAMERIIRRDKPDFIEVDCSIANRETEKRLIPAAADVGAAVLIALPFGRSSLFAKVKGKPLPPMAAEIGAATWGQVFLKYLLGNPAVTCVIPGTDKASHMADNLAAGRGPMPDAKQRAEMVRYFEGLG